MWNPHPPTLEYPTLFSISRPFRCKRRFPIQQLEHSRVAVGLKRGTLWTGIRHKTTPQIYGQWTRKNLERIQRLINEAKRKWSIAELDSFYSYHPRVQLSYAKHLSERLPHHPIDTPSFTRWVVGFLVLGITDQAQSWRGWPISRDEIYRRAAPTLMHVFPISSPIRPDGCNALVNLKAIEG